MFEHWLLVTFLVVGTLLAMADVIYITRRNIVRRGPSGIPLYVIYAICFGIPTVSAGVGLLTRSAWLDVMLFFGIYLIVEFSLYKFARFKSRTVAKNSHP